MRLTGITWRGYALTFRNRYVASGSQASTRSGLLVFLRSDDGLVGTGEASPVGSSSVDEVARVAAMLEGLAPRWLGEDAGALEEAIAARDIPAALRFGLETALLDLQGKAGKCPLSVLLGGRPLSLGVNALIAAESPEQAVAEAREAIGQGFTSLKLKVGRGKLEQDDALVSVVRRAVGPGVKLRLDPNQVWDRAQAIEAIRWLSRYEIEYVEQPVAAGDITGLAEVRRAVPVPVAADESLGSLDDLHRLLSAGAADIFILKAARLGGIKAALEVASAALKAGRQVVVTTSLEAGVGIAACAHLAAALPFQPYAHGLATGLLFAQDLASPRLLPVDGMLSTPDGPGLGVKVSASLLEKYSSGIMGSAGSSFEI